MNRYNRLLCQYRFYETRIARSCFAFILMIVLWSCHNKSAKCETVQEWTLQNYKIVKTKCPDLVLAFYYKVDIFENGEGEGSGATQVDSCIFTWQADNERFLTLNTCDNLIEERRPKKIALDAANIDSATIFSEKLNRVQQLTGSQIEKLARDWNNSKTRGYSDKPFDSAFPDFPAYQYRVTIFSKGIARPFYGYNYLILDTSGWEFEMSKTADINYFHSYWKD